MIFLYSNIIVQFFYFFLRNLGLMSSSPNNTILTLKHKIFFSISDFFLFNIDGLCLIQYHNSESKFKESKSKKSVKID